MNLWTLFSSALLLTSFQFAAFAQDDAQPAQRPNDSALLKSLAICEKELSDGKLDLLRDKLRIDNVWNEIPTDEMRRTETKPSTREQDALKVYRDAIISCVKSQYATSASSNEGKTRPTWSVRKEQLINEFEPLIRGEITYAEYARRIDQRIMDDMRDIKQN